MLSSELRAYSANFNVFICFFRSKSHTHCISSLTNILTKMTSRAKTTNRILDLLLKKAGTKNNKMKK